MISPPLAIAPFLPHRAPMLMVTHIVNLDEVSVTTEFDIEPDNIFVQADGFFSAPGLVENAAQTCASIVARTYFSDQEPQKSVMGFISAIKTLEILELPKAGCRIVTKATLVSNFAGEGYFLSTMDCETFYRETPLVKGRLNLYIQEQTA